MPWGYIAGAVVSGLMGQDASSSAADAQIRSGEASNATQMAMYEQNRAGHGSVANGGRQCAEYAYRTPTRSEPAILDGGLPARPRLRVQAV